MANIIFCVPPMAGPINAGLKLARELKNRQHNVTYVGIADCEPRIFCNGFDFVAVFEKWFPKGWLDDFYQQFQHSEREAFNHQLINFLEHLRTGGDAELLKVFAALSPDLIIISASEFDSIFWALLAYKANIKSVYLFGEFGGTASYTSPPNYTDVTTNGSLWSSVKIAWAWFKHILIIKYDELYLAWNGIEYLSSKRI